MMTKNVRAQLPLQVKLRCIVGTLSIFPACRLFRIHHAFIKTFSVPLRVCVVTSNYNAFCADCPRLPRFDMSWVFVDTADAGLHADALPIKPAALSGRVTVSWVRWSGAWRTTMVSMPH